VSFERQPHLENDLIRLEPLQAGDFESLYAVAADPLIWEQHPNRDRFQREVFANFFKGAMESGGALRVHDRASGALLGSSRYYDVDESASVAAIGYTFLARSVWGRPYNLALKTLMLNHAFRFVDRVVFHVGKNNLRSRRAMEKLGGVLAGEMPVSYYGEPSSTNVIYEIDRADWTARVKRSA
jgi:RimJ/RimL family protein N-acetyltransferase